MAGRKLKKLDRYGTRDMVVHSCESYLEGKLYDLIEVPLYGETGLSIYSELVKLSRARGYSGEAGIVVALLEVLHSYSFEKHISEHSIVEEREEEFIVPR